MAGVRQTNVPEGFDFSHTAETDQLFENALEKAHNGERLTVDDGVELLTTGTGFDGIDLKRKERVLEAADRRRAEVVGEDVTFVVNLNNNVTTACNTGCLFCNFKDPAGDFEEGDEGEQELEQQQAGFTKTPAESREIVESALERGIYEVCSVSGLHPALALDDEHLEILDAQGGPNYKPRSAYRVDPGTYIEQIEAMNVGGIHVHSMTPEEAAHAKRGTDWSYEYVYRQLADAGLDSAPGTAAEILVDEVRDVICPNKIDTQDWLDAMEAAMSVGLDTTATIMYGHVENEMHRAMHLDRVRELQERTGAITEFVPLSFIHYDTPLHDEGMVTNGTTRDEDELMIAVSRLYLDNIENIQSSWVKFGDELGLKLLSCGANDFMGTILSEEITKRAGGEFGEFRSVAEYTDMITSIGREPVERSTDYRQHRAIDPSERSPGPQLGPKADGTPLVDDRGAPADD
jgi:FO synthase subunit 2